MAAITVEFFGIPRRKAGRPELSVEAATVREALQQVAAACPELGDVLTPSGRVAAYYLLSIGGESFVTDLDEKMEPGTRLLLLSADAGG